MHIRVKSGLVEVYDWSILNDVISQAHSKLYSLSFQYYWVLLVWIELGIRRSLLDAISFIEVTQRLPRDVNSVESLDLGCTLL